MTDLQLLKDYLQTRSHDAFAAIVGKYVHLVYCTARRIVRDPQLADDVTQGAFLVLSRRASDIDPRYLAGWLVKTAQLTAKAAIRSQMVRQKHEAFAAEMRTETLDRQEPTIEQISPLLDEALSTLGEKDRTAVVLRFLQAMPFADVGETIGCSEKAAQKRVRRALEKLRKHFLEGDLVPSIGGLALIMAANQTRPATVSRFESAQSPTEQAMGLADKVIAAMRWAHLKVAASIALAVTLLVVSATMAVQLTSSAAGNAQSEPTPAAAPSPLKTSSATGRLRLRFTQRSPLCEVETLIQRLEITDPANQGGLSLDRSKWVPDIGKELFDAYVPTSYSPDVPHSLYVWIGVADMPPDWEQVFSRQKMIAVTAFHAKDFEAEHLITDLRHSTYAIDIVHNMKQMYNIDADRIYIAGFSRGASKAATLLRTFPEVFSGGVFLMGGVFHRNYNHSRDSNEGPWESTVLRAWPDWKSNELDKLKKSAKIVLVRGETDDVTWTAAEGRIDYLGLRLDGFERASYLEIPKWKHVPPPAKWFEKAIEALESPPRVSPTTSPTAEADPLDSQNQQARRLYLAALSEFHEIERLKPEVRQQMERTRSYDRFVTRQKDKSRPFLEKILTDYPTSPSARDAQKLLYIMDADAPAAIPRAK